MFGNVYSFLLVVAGALTNVIGGTLFRLGMQKSGIESLNPGYLMKHLLSVVFQPLVFAGFISFAISAIIWLRVLTVEPLGRVYPILTAFIILFLVVSSTIFLREPLTLARIAGMALIVLGTFLVFAR